MTFPEILNSTTAREGGGFIAHVPKSWLQGRTAFGGLSAALCLEAAMRSEPDLPPLRSAQIAFIGPVVGDVVVETRLLRRGRTAAFIEATLYCEGKPSTRGLFVFMIRIDSEIDLDQTMKADPIPVDEAVPVAKHPDPNFFVNNFALRHSVPKSDERKPEIQRWCCLREREGLHPAVELMAIGDALPPAAMMLAKEFGPISTVNWMVNFLTDQPATKDGWWLTRAEADYARNGTSSQAMQVWNTDGQLVMSGFQSVAIFV